MKDTYPRYDAVPSDYLAGPALQPDYIGSNPLAERSTADAILVGGYSRAGRADATAIVRQESGASLTFGDIDGQSRRLAEHLLRLGCRRGVAISSGKRTEGMVSAVAVWRGGGIVVPVSLQPRAEERNSDADANVTCLGRTDYLISMAGYKVAPVEVETLLAAHPVVRVVAVRGRSGPIRQSVVCAFVAVNPGTVANDELQNDELQDTVKRQLAPYKSPGVIDLVDALPRGLVGKVIPRSPLEPLHERRGREMTIRKAP